MKPGPRTGHTEGERRTLNQTRVISQSDRAHSQRADAHTRNRQRSRLAVDKQNKSRGFKGQATEAKRTGGLAQALRAVLAADGVEVAVDARLLRNETKTGKSDKLD
jgi:hypothetical protein